MPPATKEQGPAQRIGTLVSNVGSQDELFELFTVVVELLLIELILQELRDNLSFSNEP
jgi:hypothetical protein